MRDSAFSSRIESGMTKERQMDQEKLNKRTPRRRPECDRAVSAEQQVRFLLGMRNGLTVAAAARWAGVAVATLYYRRRIDASFAELWREAVAGASADVAAVRAAERAADEAAQGTKVCAHGDRVLVRKKRRIVDFTPERKQLFLDHIAESCNMDAAAAAAGVTGGAARKALAEDADFAEAFDVALAVGYKALEADTLHQVQMAYRLSPDGPAGAAGSGGDKQTFERSMQLLHEYRRRDGTIGRRPSPHHRKMASKEEVVQAVAKLIREVRQRNALLAQAKLPPPNGPGPMDC
jgi:hypothetical protein